MVPQKSKNTASPKQLFHLDRLSKENGWRLPRGIKANREMAGNWLAVGFAVDSGKDIQSLGSDSSDEDTITDAISNLTTHYEFDAPTSLSLTDLNNWISALGKHVRMPDADKLLHYWQDALKYCDLSKLVQQGQDVAPDLKEATLAQSLPAARNFEMGAAEEGRVSAVLVAYSTLRNTSRASALLAIPLSVDSISQGFVPVFGGAAPFFNREWLEPVVPDREKPAYFGTVNDCERFVLTSPPPGEATWPEYWSYVASFVRAVAGTHADLRQIAQVVERGDTHWKIVPWETRGTGVAISKVYQEVLDGASAALLRQLIKPPFAPEPMDETRAIEQAPKLTGHMDTYNADKARREGFGLERSQRVAATAMTAIASGQLLAVNGPPGTGKTSFLRAVIATCWVDAALKGADPPILLATAATNKAVTNIIESFSAIPGPPLQPDWESRWLPSLPSYGWFFPAGSKKDEELADFMLLRKAQREFGDTEPYVLRGAAAEFATAAIDQRGWLVEGFLDLHRRCLGLSHAEASPSQAASSIQRCLSDSVAEMRALQRRFATWIAMPTSFDALTQPLEDWTEQLACASRELADIESKHTCQSALMTTLIKALAHVAQAEALEARGCVWWARILSPIIGDRWGPSAIALRAAALADLVNDPLIIDAPQLLSAAVLQRRVKDQEKEAAHSKKAMTKAKDRLATVERTLKQIETWRAEGARLVNDASVSVAAESSVFQAWFAQAIAEPMELALTFEAAIDLKFRFMHFHMAARYWEARWLADPPTQADCGDELTALRRVAMLAPVIVSTVYTLPRIHRTLEFADVLIFDEAGQAAPEIGAASFAFAKRAIVVGDTAQLKPVWNVDAAGSARLAADRDIDDVPPTVSSYAGSIMQAAQGITQFSDPPAYSKVPGVNLRAHYRCRADIIEYNRRLLYGNLLMPRRREMPPFIYPAMAWVAVPSKGGLRRHFKSWVNDDEVNEIVRWLRHEEPRLLAHYKKIALSQIVAIIAPFRAQADALKKALSIEFGVAAQDMVINTVHALQGAEKPIVAFSLTQTAEPYFVESDGPNLLNVAVSRAQDSFILFAAPSVLKRTGHAKKTNGPLDLLVDYMAERGRRLYPRECVIIEAPGKLEVVEQALGLSARVIATHGHFRELDPSRDDFTFQASKEGESTMQQLKEAAADMGQYDAIYLATDDDEDGEEIAWHVIQVLRDAGLRNESKFRRMRFYALTPKEIQRARDLALPGIDARRVKTSLMRKLVDARLHKTLRQKGVSASRPELAVLREVVTRTTVPVRFAIRVQGQVNGHSVVGDLMDGDGSLAQPRHFCSHDVASSMVKLLSQQTSHRFLHRFNLPKSGEWYPANTTAQVMIHAYRQWQWMPARTMDALRVLYEGKAIPRALGSGDRKGSDI